MLEKVSMIVTSPPYYGMRTYFPDQWLRHWFLGGPSNVEYQQSRAQLSHQSPEAFANQLRIVWQNEAVASRPDALLVCRFGSISGRNYDAVDLIKESFKNTHWRIRTMRSAGNALDGRRQAAQFGTRPAKRPMLEYDIYAKLLD